MIVAIFLLSMCALVLTQRDLPLPDRNCVVDCNTAKCSPCSDLSVVDFVFVVDASGSMQPAIDAVRKGFSRFTDEIIARDISARYMIVMYGRHPEIVLDWVDDGYLCRDALAQVRAAQENVFLGPDPTSDTTEYGDNPPTWLAHDNHDCDGCQTREATFEVISMVLGKANYNVFSRRADSKSAQLTGPVVFRPKARKFIIAITNEDNDCPFHEQNKLKDSTLTGGGSAGRQCPIGADVPGGREVGMEPPNPFPLTNDGTVADLWRREIDQTAASILSADAWVNIFLDEEQPISVRQFGNPGLAAENDDFSNFDAAETLRRYTTADGGAYVNSLQAQVLRSDIKSNMRLFRIRSIVNPTVVKNFFDSVVSAIDQGCMINRKRQQGGEEQEELPVCYEYRCSCDKGCEQKPLCNEGCPHCNLRFTPQDTKLTCVEAGSVNPNNGCQTCSPFVSLDRWSSCDDLNPCTTDTCTASVCKSEPICSAECGFCRIAGECHPLGALRDSSGCEVCNPTENFAGWTRKNIPECAVSPAPAGETPAPTSSPDANTPGTVGGPLQCGGFSRCRTCTIAVDADLKEKCQWCYDGGMPSEGACVDLAGTCPSGQTLSITASAGTCPLMLTEMTITKRPTPAPVPAGPSPAQPTTPAVPTPDPGKSQRCTDDMAIGEMRTLPFEWNAPKPYCLCGPDRTLLCSDKQSDCLFSTTQASCEQRGEECCFRTTIAGPLCLESNNKLCQSPQKPPPGWNRNPGVDEGMTVDQDMLKDTASTTTLPILFIVLGFLHG